MSRTVAYTLAALCLSASSLAIAQTTQPMQMQMQMPMKMQMDEAQSESRDLTDIRIDVVKNALQLTPDQAKYWPAVEEAIRSRAEERRERFERLAARMREPQADRNIVRVLQNRADNLAERATSLKKLADAWQPLYPTLTDAQKRRLRILAAVVIHHAREGMEARHHQAMMMEEEEDGWQW